MKPTTQSTSSLAKASQNRETSDMEKICIVIPTYNNCTTLKSVVEECKLYCDAIYVVNDGSTDNTEAILSSIEGIETISYPKNRGKGYALQKGLERATADGYRYCITIDSDGQHYPSEIPLFIETIKENPDSLVIGARNLNAENMPGKNSFANKFSNFWYKVETLQELNDTQSGFRLYPLEKLKGIRLFTGKYEFELEIIVRAAWRGIRVFNIPIKVYYPPAGERISHFKPLRDFTRISLLNTLLVLGALLWYYPKLLIKSLTLKNIRDFFRKNVTHSGESDQKIAASIGYGAFCGIIPIWGYQMIFAGLSAHFLKLNKVIAIFASNISLPPLIPFIIYGSLYCGKIILGKEEAIPFGEVNLEFASSALLQYLIGSITFATIMGLLVYIVSLATLKLTRRVK